MKKFIFLWLLVISSIANADAGNPHKKDVQEFEDNAETCDHLSGEWDAELPEENKREIKANMNDACGKAQELYGTLEKKYKNDKAVLRLLKQHRSVKNFQHWD